MILASDADATRLLMIYTAADISSPHGQITILMLMMSAASDEEPNQQ
jgi:hypothetical protein